MADQRVVRIVLGSVEAIANVDVIFGSRELLAMAEILEEIAIFSVKSSFIQHDDR